MALIDDIRIVVQEEIGDPVDALREEMARLTERMGSLEKSLGQSLEVLQHSEQRWNERMQMLADRIDVALKRVEDIVANAGGGLEGEVRGLRGEVQAELKRVHDAVANSKNGMSTEIGGLKEQLLNAVQVRERLATVEARVSELAKPNHSERTKLHRVTEERERRLGRKKKRVLKRAKK